MADKTIGSLPNLASAQDDALLVIEFLGKSYNTTLGQLKTALGAITGFAKTAGDSTPGTNDVYTITFANGGKLDITIPIPKEGKNGYTPQKGVDYFDGYTPQKGVDYFDGYTPQKGVDYADGFSPTVELKEVSDGVEITITDATGPHTAKLPNARDGISPTFRVETIEGGYRVILSAANQYQSFDLLNGEGSNWLQKAPAGVGYVKHRPIYRDVYGVNGDIIVASVNFTTNFAAVEGLQEQALEVGGKYNVGWNGKHRWCECKYDPTDGPYIGNAALLRDGLEDTGEPFCIYCLYDNVYTIEKDTDTAESIAVIVTGEEVIDLQRLPWWAVPEGYPYREIVATEVIPERLAIRLTDSNFGTVEKPITIALGKQYIVKWDGTEYACVGKEYVTDEMTSVCLGDASSLTGGESTGEPFAVVMVPVDMAADLGYYARIYRNSGSALAKIVVSEIKEVVHPMVKEFIPDGVGVTDYNKLDNRPVSKEVTHSDTLTWDGNTDGLVSAVEVLFKVSDAVPTKEDCANGLSLTIAGQTMTVPGEEAQAMFADDGFANLEYAAFVPTDNYDAGDDLVFPKAGVYFASADGMAVTELVIPGYTGFTATKIQKLDMDFLPEGYPYKAVEQVEVLPEMTVEGGEEVPVMTEIELVEGNTYTVKWNGTKYTCVAQKWELDGTPAGVIVGDIGMLETGEPTTGEPFLIADLNEDMAAGIGVPTLLMCIDGSTSVTLSITGKAEVVYEMAGEYLPDGTPSVTPFDDVIMAEWPADIGSDGSFRGSVGTVIPGAVYKVNWGGTVYECVARKAAIGVCLGSCPDKYTGDGIATTDPFAIIFVSPELVAQGYPSGIIGPVTPPENNEFSVVGYLKVQKINEHCLPERKEPLFVTLSKTDGVYTADVPYEVMKDAIMRQNRMVLIADDVIDVSGDTANVFSFSYRDSSHYYFQSVYIKNAKVYIKTIDWYYDETITVTTQYINTEVVTEG